jgi:hypothetical protein
MSKPTEKAMRIAIGAVCLFGSLLLGFIGGVEKTRQHPPMMVDCPFTKAVDFKMSRSTLVEMLNNPKMQVLIGALAANPSEGDMMSVSSMYCELEPKHD